jgi:hypothetical protein
MQIFAASGAHSAPKAREDTRAGKRCVRSSEHIGDFPLAFGDFEVHLRGELLAEIDGDLAIGRDRPVHVLEVIETEERAGRSCLEVDQVLFFQFEMHVVGVALRFDVEDVLFLPNPERDVIGDHIRGFYCTIDVPALDDDSRREIEIGDVRLLANGVGIDEREGVLQSVEADVQLSSLLVEFHVDQPAGVGHPGDVLQT